MRFDNESISETNAIAAALYSSLTRRLLAFLIDGVVIGVIGALCAMAVPFLGAAIAWILYAPVFESSEWRATPGKHLVGVQVTDLMGRQISFRSALLRNFLKLISFAFVLLGFFVAIFSSQKQALHDLLADTVVVYGRNEQPLGEVWSRAVKELWAKF